jgi:hypothetical protein
MNDLIKALERFRANPTPENERELFKYLPREEDFDQIIKVQSACMVDDFQREVYFDEFGKMLVDTNCGMGSIDLHYVSNMEPEYRLEMFEVVDDLYTKTKIQTM